MKKQIKRLIKGSAIYGIGNTLNKFIAVLLLPIFTTYLTPADYGIMSLLNILSLLLIQISLLGLGTSIGLCYFEKKKRESGKTIWSAFSILITTSILVIGISIILSKQINLLLFNSTQYQYLVFLTLIRTFFTILVVPFTLRLLFEEKRLQFIIITTISTLLTITVNIVLIVILHLGIKGMVLGTLISAIMTFFLFAIPTIKRLPFNIDLKLCRRLITYGIPMIPSFLCLYFLQQGNVFFLKKFTNLNTVGLYSIGYRFGAGMMLIVSSLNTAWFPFYMSFINKKSQAKILFGKIFTYYIFVAGFISLCFYTFAKIAVTILTKSNFYNSYQAIGLSSTALMIMGMFSLLMPPIYFAKKIKYLTIIQIIATVFFGIISLFLVPKFEIIGANISLILSYSIIAVSIFFLARSNKHKYLQITYEWKRILIFVCLYTFFAFFSLCNKQISIYFELVISLILLTIIITISYFLLYYNEKQFIKNCINLCLSKLRKNNNLV